MSRSPAQGRGGTAIGSSSWQEFTGADIRVGGKVALDGAIMLTNNNAISFVATRDAAAARSFYETTLGLRLVADEPFALVFDVNGRMLRIAKTEALDPAAHTVLGWDVDDIETKVDELRARGVAFLRFNGMPQDALGIWTSPSGARVAWFKDPDGNNLSLTQFSRTGLSP